MQPSIVLTGIVMGVAFAAPPGAVTAETFRRGVRGGFPLAFGVQLGSLIGDATYALIALIGLAALAQNPTLEVALGAFGAIFLMYLACMSFAGARAPTTAVLPDKPVAERRGAFLSGLALSLANPWAVAFWLSLGGALVSVGVSPAAYDQTAFFFGSFVLGSALWAFILSIAIGKARRWMRPEFAQAVSIACGIALGSFGLIAASRVVYSLFGLR